MRKLRRGIDSEWQIDGECRALSHLAFHLNSAAVYLYHLFDDGKAQPRSLDACALVANSIKAVKYSWKSFFRYSDARITDTHNQLLISLSN